MTTYYLPIAMERNDSPNVSFRLKVIQEKNVENFVSHFSCQLQYFNTGTSVTLGNDYKLKVSIVGSVDSDTKTMTSEYADVLSEYTSEWIDVERTHCNCTISHNSNGNGDFSINVEFKADPSLLISTYYKTVGSASYSGELEQIDISNPVISDFLISADRYGLNAVVSFLAKHDTYSLTSVQFTLNGLSELQASSRMNIENGAELWKKTANADGTYSLVLTKKENLSSAERIEFDLDASTPEDAPLDSGKSYRYEILVTALNGKSATVVGVLDVPQKVTGFSCENTLDMIIGNSAELEYSIFPANAEEQGVLFESSDTNVAEIDVNGVVTAKAEGPCVITAVTVDGGFLANCSVTVLSTAAFPTLNEVVDYLTVTYFNKLLFAVDFIKEELITLGASVDELEEISLTGKNHPVTEIMSAFIAMESNCQKLRAAATAQGIAISSLPSTAQTIQKQNNNWIIIVNTWIAFLNELHSKINGGG